MKINTFCVLILLPGCLWSCQFNSKIKKEANTKTNLSEAYKDDSLIKIEISESSKKFKISDSLAIALVQQVPEIKQIIDYKYEDTTIFNQLHIENVPTDSDKTWQFKIVQFQPRTERIASLMWLFVNANNGEIRIWDIPKDTIIPLDTWLRMRTKRQQ
jgi:anionic cell wall polymer biosynthesis LytR-Cps2A-Psr (LCP) family protein